jgi:hypothetical protein
MDRPSQPRSAPQGRGQRASEPKGHAVRIVADRCEPPDLDRFVAALLALALADLDAERRRVTGEDRTVEQSSVR